MREKGYEYEKHNAMHQFLQVDFGLRVSRSLGFGELAICNLHLAICNLHFHRQWPLPGL
jgi:hypothetical protein